MAKKVFVSGVFDLLHSGHIEFFKQAAQFGELFVAVGSDQTALDLKGYRPVNNEDERLFMVKAVGYVKEAAISRGTGMLDFLEVLKQVQPDLFVVTEDSNIPEKKELCDQLGIEYKILHRTPHPGLTPRSSSALRSVQALPYRIDVAGGWLDQPFVSKFYPGPVITISLEPTIEFNERSGMATSTRRKALELWGPRLPAGDPAKLAKVLFCYDNPPGTLEISGSQDSIGLVCPGLNKAHYNSTYWPQHIESVQDEKTLQFIEQSLYLIPLGPRQQGYAVLSQTHIDRAGAKALADAAEGCWNAILAKDLPSFGRFFRASFEAQIAMFPHMMNETLARMIEDYRHEALGWKVSGAGGGGYLILVADHPIPDAVRIFIRRPDL